MRANSQLPLKQRVTFGKFQNIDMRVAQMVSAPMADGTTNPSRLVTLDAGLLGTFTSVAQITLIPEEKLVGRKVVICCNLSPRDIGGYTSEVLVLGVPRPDSPEDQDQAYPLFVDDIAVCGGPIY
ncbi:MAG: tRNA-binding protein [Proteobacteria bacterium]|nr:tRNA-binding protein [Pseudomonadota bacterium]